MNDSQAHGTPIPRRRRRNKDGRRAHRTVIRHNDAEWARVTAMATHLGVSVPGLYERAVFAGSVQAAVGIEEIHSELIGVRRLLANAANNLNQVARAANSGEGVDHGRLEASLSLFERSIERLFEILHNLPGGDLTDYVDDTRGQDEDVRPDAGGGVGA